jgi:hypothetical protein
MKENYAESYNKLYGEYSLPTMERAGKIRSIIETTSAKFKLRQDAKYFLLINFVQMVVLPLGPDTAWDRLEKAIQHDVELLAQAANRVAHGAEATGHAIVDALKEVWNQLEINHFRLWN